MTGPSKELLERGARAMFESAAWSSFWSLEDAKILTQANYAALQPGDYLGEREGVGGVFVCADTSDMETLRQKT